MKEDFTYCDQVSIIEEGKPASVNRLATWQRTIRCVENAWIVPFGCGYDDYQGEILTDTGDIVPDVCSGSIYNQKWTIDLPKEFEEKNEVIYLGAVNPCWGHYITDGISKLWCVDSPEFLGLVERGVPVVFVSEWMCVDRMGGAWRHLVDLLGGASIDIVPLTAITKFKKIYIPTNSIQHSANGRFYTESFTKLVCKLKDAALNGAVFSKVYDKIYLSRTKLSNGGHTEFGEKQLENAFKRVGYHVVYPEQLTFEEQVWLLHHAKSVVGTMGSISHNFMFCQPGTEVIILRKAWYTNDFQYVINQVANLNVTYIDCNLSVFIDENTNGGPFFLYINENVQRFFADRYNISLQNGFNRRLFGEYALLCMQRGNFKERNVAPIYYYDKMYEELKMHPGLWKQIYRRLSPILRSQFKGLVKKITR